MAARANSEAHQLALAAAPAAGEPAKKVCPIRKSFSMAYMATSDLLLIAAGGGTTQSPYLNNATASQCGDWGMRRPQGNAAPYMLPSAKRAAPVELYRPSM